MAPSPSPSPSHGHGPGVLGTGKPAAQAPPCKERTPETMGMPARPWHAWHPTSCRRVVVPSQVLLAWLVKHFTRMHALTRSPATHNARKPPSAPGHARATTGMSSLGVGTPNPNGWRTRSFGSRCWSSRPSRRPTLEPFSACECLGVPLPSRHCGVTQVMLTPPPPLPTAATHRRRRARTRARTHTRARTTTTTHNMRGTFPTAPTSRMACASTSTLLSSDASSDHTRTRRARAARYRSAGVPQYIRVDSNDGSGGYVCSAGEPTGATNGAAC